MVNLHMKDSRAAERLALMHAVAFESLIEDKRKEIAAEALKPRPKPLAEYSDEEMVRLAKDLSQGFNRAQHAALRDLQPRADLEGLHMTLSKLAGDVLSAQGAEGLKSVTAVFLCAAGIPFKESDKSFKAMVFEFATALDTDYIKPSERRLYGREAVPPPPLRAPQSPVAAPKRLTLGEVVDRHIKAEEHNKTGYTRKVVRCLNLFKEVIGADMPIDALKQTQVTDFLRDICRLPKDWARRYDKGEVTLAELFAEDAEEVMAPLTYADNYRAPLKAFLSDARRDFGADGFPDLTVDRIKYSGDRVAGEDKQRALTVPELQTLFEGPRFAAMARDPSDEGMYWFSILSLYTGARPRELCQANPQVDFGQEEGHWYIDLTPNTPAGAGIKKSIKTGEERRIPMHPELIRLGFPEYVQRIKGEGADRLFPSFRVKKGNPFEAAGDDFTQLLKDVSLYDDKAAPGRVVLGAYVMRKTFITQCSHQGVVSKEITGHSDGTSTVIQDRHYVDKVEPFARKLAELSKLAIPVVIPKRST